MVQPRRLPNQLDPLRWLNALDMVTLRRGSVPWFQNFFDKLMVGYGWSHMVIANGGQQWGYGLVYGYWWGYGGHMWSWRLRMDSDDSTGPRRTVKITVNDNGTFYNSIAVVIFHQTWQRFIHLWVGLWWWWWSVTRSLRMVAQCRTSRQEHKQEIPFSNRNPRQWTCRITNDQSKSPTPKKLMLWNLVNGWNHGLKFFP